MSSWSELPLDLLVAIAERIKKLEDFIAFGAVCKGWFAVGKKKEYFKGLWLWQGAPYLMLPARDDNNVDAHEFYSLVESKIVASLSIPKLKERKCYESLGWLLAVDNDGTMCLLDPFTSVEIPVPHQSTFPGYEVFDMDEYVYVWKFVLSTRPSETSDFIVMIIAGSEAHLGFWRPGDESWNKIGIREKSFRDVMYYGGNFYAINVNGYVWVYTLEGDNLTKGRIVTHLVVDELKNIHAVSSVDNLILEDTLYILKTSESLLMISRTACWWHEEDYRTYHNTVEFRVYEVDMSTSTWREIENVGSMAIFVGHNTTFSIDTCRSFGKIKGNHIYFTDDGWESYHLYEEGGSKDMGAYNIETGTIESFYSGEVLLNKVCPPIWVTPSF